MRNEERPTQQMRDKPTEMRKTVRSVSRERDRRVRFKLNIAKTKVQVISDSQSKHVVVDEELPRTMDQKRLGQSRRTYEMIECLRYKAAN